MKKPIRFGIRDEQRLHIFQVGRPVMQMGRMDLDDQQRDGDGEHCVGKEDHPFERMIGLRFFSLSLMSALPRIATAAISIPYAGHER